MTYATSVRPIRSLEQVPAATALFLANGERSYISHSEIQFDRAPDPANWADDLARQLDDELSALALQQDLTRMLIGAYAGDTLAGWAIMGFETDVRHPFAVIEDMIVAAGSRRLGLGAAMLGFVVKEARARGVSRLFLESGRANHAAHDFFHAQGFHSISVVMMREIGVGDL